MDDNAAHRIPAFGHTMFRFDGTRTQQEGPLTEEAQRLKDRCIKAAAVVVAECYRILYTFPIEEAARRAVRPGGPTYEELLVIIAEKRELYLVKE
jgi:hypothetical protein